MMIFALVIIPKLDTHPTPQKMLASNMLAFYGTVVVCAIAIGGFYFISPHYYARFGVAAIMIYLVGIIIRIVFLTVHMRRRSK